MRNSFRQQILRRGFHLFALCLLTFGISSVCVILFVSPGLADGLSVSAQGISPAHIDSPTSLTATALSSSSILLNWQDNSDNEVGFHVQRLSSNNWQTIGTVSGVQTGKGARSYTNNGLQANTAHRYRIEAFNDFPQGLAYSNETTGTTSGSPGNPGSATSAPARLTNLSAATQPRSIRLTWQVNSHNETAIEVRKALGRTNFILERIATLAPGETSYTDNGVQPGTTNYYIVCAVNSGGQGCTERIEATTESLPTPPPPPPPPPMPPSTPPYDVRVRQGSDGKSITISWRGQTEISREGPLRGQEVFLFASKVHRRRSSDIQTLLKTLAKGITNYTDEDVKPNTLYSYHVCATNEVGETCSRGVELTTAPLKPNVPIMQSAVALSTTSIKLSWRANDTSETGASNFIVQRDERGA